MVFFTANGAVCLLEQGSVQAFRSEINKQVTEARSARRAYKIPIMVFFTANGAVCLLEQGSVQAFRSEISKQVIEESTSSLEDTEGVIKILSYLVIP